ncbi:MAG: ABC transporter ATP-binding protein [Bacillati bacterium ANGP1]|uniref:ABC transporter ATP-binding protein n=1 Tax=Candidatus Segetimicrobium genomatis TaxID=2569760 RepID=A0A537LR07_9BACT|nr:MAG: ABC transporter ATP-binding protein [Terrabacteria group bacterium ANGP1]
MDALRMEEITKRFGPVLANDRITLTVQAGTVHSLLGENGAGKTSLMNILYGLYQPDDGRIWVRGRPVRIRSPRDAIRLGIGMIHQQFTLVPQLTVAENIILGLRPRHPPFLDLSAAEDEIEGISKAYGLNVDPGSPVMGLSVGMQQRVEILKALYRGANLLILDEPTSVLTPLEIETLFEVIKSLVADGKSVIFISHKLGEALRISQTITVLRHGRVVATVPRTDATPNALARMMVGREVVFRIPKTPARTGEPALEVAGLWTAGDRGHPAVKGITFRLFKGEILGISGVDGNGQTELAEAIAGLRPATAGRIGLDGQEVTSWPPKARIAAGLAFIPADRYRLGLVPDFTVAENFIIKNFAAPPFASRGFLDRRAIAEHARTLVDRFDIRVHSLQQRARELSGGNQQKVVLAREVSLTPAVIIAMQPTRGLDVGASEYILRELIAQRDRGAAILHLSTELEETLAGSDRVGVMFGGELMGIVRPEDVSYEQLGLMMAGALRLNPAEPA